MIDDFLKLSRPLIYLYAGTMVTRIGTFVFPYLTIYLSESRAFGFDKIGLILSTGSVGLLAGNLIGGCLADVWSRRNTLVLALLINAAGFSGLAFEYRSGWPYAIFLMIGYLGSGMYNPAANALIADMTDEAQRPFAYTVNYVCVNVGMALGPLIGGFLATIGYVWIFAGDVMSSLICALLLGFGISKSTGHPEKLPIGDSVLDNTAALLGRRIWLQHPLVVVFCLAYFFLICPLMGLEYAVPILVKHTFSQDLFYVGVIYTTNAVCILTLSFAIEKILRKRNDVHSMIVAGGCWSLGLGILLFGYSLTSLLVCTVVWTMGEIVASITVPTYISRRVEPHVKGRFLALNDVVRSLAGVICPIGLGFVWTHQGPKAVLGVLTALPLIAMAAYVAIGIFEKSRFKTSQQGEFSAVELLDHGRLTQSHSRRRKRFAPVKTAPAAAGQTALTHRDDRPPDV